MNNIITFKMIHPKLKQKNRYRKKRRVIFYSLIMNQSRLKSKCKINWMMCLNISYLFKMIPLTEIHISICNWSFKRMPMTQDMAV